MLEACIRIGIIVFVSVQPWPPLYFLCLLSALSAAAIAPQRLRYFPSRGGVSDVGFGRFGKLAELPQLASQS